MQKYQPSEDTDAQLILFFLGMCGGEGVAVTQGVPNCGYHPSPRIISRAIIQGETAIKLCQFCKLMLDLPKEVVVKL